MIFGNLVRFTYLNTIHLIYSYITKIFTERQVRYKFIYNIEIEKMGFYNHQFTEGKEPGVKGELFFFI